MRRKLAAGNWKINGVASDLTEVTAMAEGRGDFTVDVLICPSATLIERMATTAAGTGIAVGGQDCHAAKGGAHTGDIAAAQLVDAGASHVILGHSERRADHGESNEAVHAKVQAAWGAELIAVLCIGETEAQYKAGETLAVLKAQLDGSLPDATTAERLVVAYEPVWAIGTGLVPTLAEIGAVHGFIRSYLAARLGAAEGDGIRLLYGGSVKPSNAAEIFAVAEVDGALVGGASLKAADFGPIIAALENA